MAPLVFYIWNALCDLVLFVQFKKREKKKPWRSDTFNKVAGCNFTKYITPPWVFYTFCYIVQWYQIAKSITIEHIPLFSYSAIR